MRVDEAVLHAGIRPPSSIARLFGSIRRLVGGVAEGQREIKRADPGMRTSGESHHHVVIDFRIGANPASSESTGEPEFRGRPEVGSPDVTLNEKSTYVGGTSKRPLPSRSGLSATPPAQVRSSTWLLPPQVPVERMMNARAPSRASVTS